MSERMCIVTRARGEPDDLVRFVCGPDGAVVPDIRCELPGRGVWVEARGPLVAEAVKRRLFGHGLGGDCRASEDLPGQVADLLRRAALGYLALANKAGLAVAGFEKVAAAIGKGRVAVLLEAADGAEDGRRKLEGKLASSGQQVEIVRSFDSAALDLALGRPHVIHAALAAGGLTGKFVAATRKFEAYIGISEILNQA
ncbi:MAG TPA: RNA-binding protein [Aestuariivirgaceae bacterium]|nr:RNA-binding protein [Aestuariivirgaceae bacterium]